LKAQTENIPVRQITASLDETKPETDKQTLLHTTTIFTVSVFPNILHSYHIDLT